VSRALGFAGGDARFCISTQVIGYHSWRSQDPVATQAAEPVTWHWRSDPPRMLSLLQTPLPSGRNQSARAFIVDALGAESSAISPGLEV
jgi:hypothetical protein